MSTADGFYGATSSTDNRIGRITDQTTLILAGFLGRKIDKVMDVIPSALVYDTIQRGQEYLAEETLCLEKSASLTFSSGSVAEPTGFYRMNFIVLSSTVSLQPIEIDVEEKDRLSRTLTALESSNGVANPGDSYFYRYGGSIYTWPALTDGSYTTYYWGRPTTTVSTSVLPETPAYMDTALIYWAVKEIAPMVRQGQLQKIYMEKFMREFARIQAVTSRTITVDRTMTVSDLG